MSRIARSRARAPTNAGHRPGTSPRTCNPPGAQPSRRHSAPVRSEGAGFPAGRAYQGRALAASGARRARKARVTRPAVALLNSTVMVDFAALPSGGASRPCSARDRFGGRLRTEHVSQSRCEPTDALTGRAQDRDRDLALGALLVDRVFVVYLDQPWPKSLLLLGRSLAGD